MHQFSRNIRNLLKIIEMAGKCTEWKLWYLLTSLLYSQKIGTHWRKYRIEMHSESIIPIPIHSVTCNQANANHFERIRKTFCISFDEKRSKIDLTYSESTIRRNPNQSDQSELGFIQTVFSIRINTNESEVGIIWINSD